MSIENGRITLHSRSGRPRSRGSNTRGRNPDYVAAFDALFERINAPSAAIKQVLLDSAPARAFSEANRTLATAQDFAGDTLATVRSQIRARMRAFGRSGSMPANEGNQNKKLRIDTNLEDEEIIRRLRMIPADGATPANDGRAIERIDRLPAAELRRVGPAHIQAALKRLDAGDPASAFAISRDYDVKTGDGQAYSPKKVFGLALEEALGINAKPGHFSAGWGTPCFDILENSGLWIVPKAASAARPKPSATEVADATGSLIPTDEERIWIEGNPRIAVHLRKERHPGVAAKKRIQFIALHGRLLCERCGLDPVEEYGTSAGNACIEVHHHRTHVTNMQPGHETSLDDLKCLCSNCHRVLHRSLALGLDFVL
jgi:5-methylcytosine-specific restriction protein A